MDIIEWLDNLLVSEINLVNLYDMGADSYPMRNRGRYHHGFLYTFGGEETYHFKNKSITAVPDSIIYIPRGYEYGITLNGKRSLVMTIDFEFDSDFQTEPFIVKFEKNNTVRSLFTDIEKTWNRKKAGTNSACKSVFYKIVYSIIKQKNLYMTSDKYSKISEAVNFLPTNYLDSDFRIEYLSEISGISSRYFEKLFQQKFGTTPKEYVTNMRIERAKELLMSEKNLVGDIALSLGYNSVYHFGKIFKLKTGQTPSEYRREHFKRD
ncbi:MAG: helix-turn-helix transcriptional regulator [Clostridia bacterium]|nr:helix-turn-helix transcriptional regulator [Clostridia bacterium]